MLMASWRSGDFCSIFGSVIRRLIPRPSAVGRTMPALYCVDSRAMALIGVMGWTASAPTADGLGTTEGRHLSRCFRVTRKA